MSWLINLVPYHGLWQQVMVHYVKQLKRPFQLSWRNFLHLRSVCQTTLQVSLTQWALFKSKNVIKRSFQKWSSRSSAVSLWKVGSVKKLISFLMYIEISLLKTWKGLMREVQHWQLLSKAFLANHWQSFIKGSRYKMEFICFMCKEQRKLYYRLKFRNRHLYLAYEQECWLLTRDSVTKIHLSFLWKTME